MGGCAGVGSAVGREVVLSWECKGMLGWGKGLLVWLC